MECGIEARVEKIQDSAGGEEFQAVIEHSEKFIHIVHSEKLQMR